MGTFSVETYYPKFVCVYLRDKLDLGSFYTMLYIDLHRFMEHPVLLINSTVSMGIITKKLTFFKYKVKNV